MTRALIVEDDPRIMETVVDVVESLGHEHATASCQDDARNLLNGQPYAYALLDLEIPVKQGRSFPRIENGINLLCDLVSRYGRQTPVIIMTAHGNDGPHQGVDCMKLGAADYIPKPFPITGRTLSKAIMEALENSGQAGNRGTTTKRPSGSPRPFEGGRLVLFKRRVEICGVDVPISPAMHRILTLLSEKRSNGKYAAYAGSDLTEMLGVDCGQNGIASQVLEFRNKVGQRLLEEANITCGRTDVLNSGGPGYRLQEWITIQVGTRAGNSASVPGSPSADDDPENQETATTDVDGDETDDFNDRQRWAIGQLQLGIQLQVRHLTERFGCSSITAKRDLLTLKSAGRVRFVGSPRAGHYQLTSAGKRQLATRTK
ncbi:MAG: response regulator [Planctomycetaceae bacterium]